MEQTFTSEFGGRFTVGQGAGTGRGGTKTRGARITSASSGSLACGRRRGEWAIWGGGGRDGLRAGAVGGAHLVKKSPSQFAPSRRSFSSYTQLTASVRPAARARSWASARRERSGDGFGFFSAGSASASTSGDFRLVAVEGRGLVAVGGSAVSPPDRMLSTHASSTSVDGVDDDAEPSDEVRAAGAGRGGASSAWMRLIRSRTHRGCERRTGFLTTGASAAAGTLSEGEVFSAVDVLMATSGVHTAC